MANSYYTLSDKRKYIDDDFKVNGPYKFGRLPAGRIERAAYIRDVKNCCFSWLAKYAKSSQKMYALQVVNDFLDNIENDIESEEI